MLLAQWKGNGSLNLRIMSSLRTPQEDLLWMMSISASREQMNPHNGVPHSVVTNSRSTQKWEK